MKVIATFDKSITEVLAEKVRARMGFKVWAIRPLSNDPRLMEKCLRQGHLDTYRFCDDVWTFLIKDVNFKLENQTNVTAERIKIVSCNAKKPGEQ